MSEKEIVKDILNRIQQKILYESDNYIEFENVGRESICIQFDDRGSITEIYC